MAVALDADAIIGFLDRSDALHDSAVEEIRGALGRDSLVASTVTLAEILTGALLGHHDEDVVRGFFGDLIAAVVPVDEQVAEGAARLRSQRNLRMPDALVLATASVRPEVVALITGDERIASAAPAELTVQLVEGG